MTYPSIKNVKENHHHHIYESEINVFILRQQFAAEGISWMFCCCFLFFFKFVTLMIHIIFGLFSGLQKNIEKNNSYPVLNSIMGGIIEKNIHFLHSFFVWFFWKNFFHWISSFLLFFITQISFKFVKKKKIVNNFFHNCQMMMIINGERSITCTIQRKQQQQQQKRKRKREIHLTRIPPRDSPY